MKVTFKTTASIRIPTRDSYHLWAEYEFNETTGVWKCFQSNDGFFESTNLLRELSDQQMTVLSLK